MIADDTGYRYVDETEFGVNNIGRWAEIINGGGVVVHCPVMAYIAHMVPLGVAVVFMYRDTEDIRRSQERVHWDGARDTILNYHIYPWRWLEPAKLKYMYWENVQKQRLEERAIDVEYKSLHNHHLWIEDRSGLKWNQTEIEPCVP